MPEYDNPKPSLFLEEISRWKQSQVVTTGLAGLAIVGPDGVGKSLYLDIVRQQLSNLISSQNVDPTGRILVLHGSRPSTWRQAIFYEGAPIHRKLDLLTTFKSTTRSFDSEIVHGGVSESIYHTDQAIAFYQVLRFLSKHSYLSVLVDSDPLPKAIMWNALDTLFYAAKNLGRDIWHVKDEVIDHITQEATGRAMQCYRIQNTSQTKYGNSFELTQPLVTLSIDPPGETDEEKGTAIWARLRKRPALSSVDPKNIQEAILYY